MKTTIATLMLALSAAAPAALAQTTRGGYLSRCSDFEGTAPITVVQGQYGWYTATCETETESYNSTINLSSCLQSKEGKFSWAKKYVLITPD